MTEETCLDGSGRADAKAREFKRRPCRLRLRCRRYKGAGLYGSDEKYTEGRVLNQSKGGLLIETPIWFPEGGKLEVAFNSPDDRQSFLGVVEIKWIRKVGPCFHLGVHTENLERF